MPKLASDLLRPLLVCVILGMLASLIVSLPNYSPLNTGLLLRGGNLRLSLRASLLGLGL